MSNEPGLNLKPVASRIDLEDYARIIQMVDNPDGDLVNAAYKDVSSLVREAIHKYVYDVVLDEQHLEWVREQRKKNEAARERRRSEKRGLLRRLFSR